MRPSFVTMASQEGRQDHGTDFVQHTQSDNPGLPPGPLEIAEPETPPRTRLKLILMIFALCLSMFVVALDQTIVATALPAITKELGSAAGYSWIGSAYSLASAASCTLWTRASDIWGRKLILLVTIAWFFVASIIAGVSTNMAMLIAGRALQGVAGGGILQLVVITISDLFSLRLRSLFVALIEVMWCLAGGVGPLLGGVFAQYATWRWCFYINLPINGISFILVLLIMDVYNPHTKFREGFAAIDWLGTISVLGVVLMLLLGLDFGGIFAPWGSATVICLLVFGVVMLACFLFVEKRVAKYPLMPLGMFKNWRNIAVTIVLMAHGMAFIAAEYYLPLYLQSAKEASPTRSGVLVLPLTVSGAVFGALTGVVMHSTGRYRELIWFGAVLTAVGVGLFALLDPQTSVARIVGFEILAGAGMGPLFQAPIIAIQAAVSQANTATATSTFGLLRSVSISVSLVIGGVVFQNGMQDRVKDLAHIGIDQAIVAALSGGEAAASVDLVKSVSDPFQKLAIEAAFAGSLRDMWIMFAGIAALGAVASIFVVQEHLRVEHTETKTGIEAMQQRTKD